MLESLAGASLRQVFQVLAEGAQRSRVTRHVDSADAVLLGNARSVVGSRDADGRATRRKNAIRTVKRHSHVNSPLIRI